MDGVWEGWLRAFGYSALGTDRQAQQGLSSRLDFVSVTTSATL